MNSQQQLSKLAVLPPNKTVVFYSPVEGKDVLVRTGILGEDNSFLHALLHAHSKEYIRLDKNERLKFASKLRENLAEKLDKKRWEEISMGVAVQVPFQDSVRELVEDFYKAIQKNRTAKSSHRVYKTLIQNSSVDVDTYQIICELIPLDKVKESLADIFAKFGDKKIGDCRSMLIEDFSQLATKTFDTLELDDARKKHCIKKVVRMIEEITAEANNKAYKNYLNTLKDTNITVDTFSVDLFSERFNRDIYFFDSRTRMPYCLGTPKERKSIILMWLGGTHYEVVGKLLAGNVIQREFYKDDPLIKRVNTFLYKPELVAEQYPNLIPYLPQEIRDKIGFFEQSVSHSSKSDSESDSESEHSSKSNSYSESEHSSKSKSSSRSRSKSSSRSLSSPVIKLASPKNMRRKGSKRRSRHRR